MATRGSMGMRHRSEDWQDMMDSRLHKATQEYVEKKDSIPICGSTTEVVPAPEEKPVLCGWCGDTKVIESIRGDTPCHHCSSGRSPQV